MLDHFAECVKQAKGVRQQAVQLNIFTAVLSALKVRLVNMWWKPKFVILCSVQRAVTRMLLKLLKNSKI